MLQIIRNMVKGWLAFVIVGLLIIPFAFWGINYYFDQGGQVNAATVNGQNISLQDYQRTYQSMRQQWQSISGGNFQEGIDDMLRKQAVDNIVQRELLKQTNKTAGLRVSDAKIRETINGIQYFQGIGGFDQALYESALSQLGFTPASFEAQIRQDVMAEQMQNALVGSAFITQQEALRFARLKNQARDISYAVLSSNDAKENLELFEDDIENYYNQDNQQFQEPEKVKIAYIVLSLDKIAEGIAVSEEDLVAYYEVNKGIYSVEEQRNIKQLMVGLEEGNDATSEKSENLASEIHGLLSAGQSFEDVASRYADNEEVTVEFSEFGFLTRGILEAEADDAAFALAEGEFSEPVRTKFGFHIVAVDEIKAVETSGFEDIREEVEADYKKNEAEKRFYGLTDDLAAITFEQPDSLDIAATELEMEIQHSEFFSREQPGPGLISDPKIVNASFSEEVLLNGNNSEVIELDNNRNMVLRVLEHQPETKKPLEEVRERIVTRIKYERASEQTRQLGESIVAELKGGSNKVATATRHAFEWKEATGIKRDNAGIDRTVLRTAFRLGKPENGEIYAGASLASGDYAIVVVNRISEFDSENVDTNELDAITQQLQRLYANASWSQFTRNMKEQADVTVYEESL